MGTVTLYTLANIQAALGGANPISMSEYYRGGAYVPTTRSGTTTLREPASGENYSMVGGSEYYFSQVTTPYTVVYWAGVKIADTSASGTVITSYTSGSYTYYQGPFQAYQAAGDYSPALNLYKIYRTSIVPTSTAINTGVPASGAISILQLYGAANP